MPGTCFVGLHDNSARARAVDVEVMVFHYDAAHGNSEEGHMDANVRMFSGRANGPELHPTGMCTRAAE